MLYGLQKLKNGQAGNTCLSVSVCLLQSDPSLSDFYNFVLSIFST